MEESRVCGRERGERDGKESNEQGVLERLAYLRSSCERESELYDQS